MFAWREWFEVYGVPYTGADVAAMAKLAITRERALADAAKRAQWEARHRIGEDA